MLGRIGCFHFGKDHDKPIEALSKSLDEAGNVSQSLIVLPEAFNIRKRYYDIQGVVKGQVQATYFLANRSAGAQCRSAARWARMTPTNNRC